MLTLCPQTMPITMIQWSIRCIKKEETSINMLMNNNNNNSISLFIAENDSHTPSHHRKLLSRHFIHLTLTLRPKTFLTDINQIIWDVFCLSVNGSALSIYSAQFVNCVKNWMPGGEILAEKNGEHICPGEFKNNRKQMFYSMSGQFLKECSRKFILET